MSQVLNKHTTYYMLLHVHYVTLLRESYPEENWSSSQNRNMFEH